MKNIVTILCIFYFTIISSYVSAKDYCPEKILDTVVVEGKYVGIECEDMCYATISLDNSEQFTNAGELIRYTVDYNNTGNTDAQNVILTENIPSTTCFTKSSIAGLPAGVTIQYSNDGGTTWTYTPSAGTVTYNIGFRAAGGGTATIGAISDEPAFILVELL